MNQAADKLKSVIAPFVESSKTMAINISDQVSLVLSDLFPLTLHLLINPFPIQGHQARWRSASGSLLEMVKEVAKLFSDLNM